MKQNVMPMEQKMTTNKNKNLASMEQITTA
jgi:hypothetical protein